MARFIMMIFGLGLLALGGWLTFYLWPGPVLTVLEGCLALCVLFGGLVVTVFALSEVAGSHSEKTGKSTVAPPPPAPSPVDEAK